MLYSRNFKRLLFLSFLAAFAAADEELTVSSPHHRIHKRSINVGAKLANRTLNIVTQLISPYMMVNTESSEQHEYVGFIPDIILKLSQRLHFRYSFYLAPDGKYGMEESGKWNGMIGECMKNANDSRQGADMAAGPLTITRAREKVVNFVKPFQHLGLQVLTRKPDKWVNIPLYPYVFGIFQPLEPAVWGLVLLSTIVVGLFLWLMNLYNPYEWAGRHTIGLSEKDHSESFNLAGSMWFVFTSLQWQGFERSPRSIASRFLCAVWFMFVTILLVTYTAGVVNNLFWASMVHKNSQTVGQARTYTSLAQLIASKEYDIGAVSSSLTFDYIKNVAVGEEFDIIRSSWLPPDGLELFVDSTSDGVERVRNSRDRKYALIMESTTATYFVNQFPCDLQKIGEVFAKRAFGFALPNNSLILEELHAGILELAEEGEIEELEQKWFVGMGQCWNSSKVDRVFSDVNNFLYIDKPKSIDMNTFWGAIVLLVIGIVISLIIAVLEMMYFRQWGRYKSSNQPQGRQLKLEPDEGNI